MSIAGSISLAVSTMQALDSEAPSFSQPLEALWEGDVVGPGEELTDNVLRYLPDPDFIPDLTNRELLLAMAGEIVIEAVATHPIGPFEPRPLLTDRAIRASAKLIDLFGHLDYLVKYRDEQEGQTHEDEHSFEDGPLAEAEISRQSSILQQLAGSVPTEELRRSRMSQADELKSLIDGLVEDGNLE